MCFKKPTACDPGDSLWMLADHDGFLAYLQGSLGSCYLQANVMETPHTAFKVSCLLAEDPMGLCCTAHYSSTCTTHRACSWNTPPRESQSRGVIWDSCCSLSWLFFFFSNPSHAGHRHSSSGFLQQWCNWCCDHCHFSDFVCYSLYHGTHPLPQALPWQISLGVSGLSSGVISSWKPLLTS